MDLPFTLKITFIGLVTFVPIEKGGNLETMWVLLPNAIKEEYKLAGTKGPCYEPEHKDVRPDHYAFLRYHAKNLLGSNLFDHGNEQLVITPIYAEDIRIETKPGKSGTDDECPGLEGGALQRYRTRRMESPGILSRTPANDCERYDLSWIPDLRKFASPLAEICAECLQEPVTKHFPLVRVAARLKLTQGILRVESLEKKNEGGYAIYKFVDGTSEAEQALADKVTLSLEGLVQPLTLVFTSFDERVPERRITLKPATPGEVVEIDVLNHVPLGIIQPDHHLIADTFPSKIDDFRLYYKLSAAIDPTNGDGCKKYSLPVPDRLESKANHPICPKALMSPPSRKEP